MGVFIVTGVTRSPCLSQPRGRIPRLRTLKPFRGMSLEDIDIIKPPSAGVQAPSRSRPRPKCCRAGRGACVPRRTASPIRQKVYARWTRPPRLHAPARAATRSGQIWMPLPIKQHMAHFSHVLPAATKHQEIQCVQTKAFYLSQRTTTR